MWLEALRDFVSGSGTRLVGSTWNETDPALIARYQSAGHVKHRPDLEDPRMAFPMGEEKAARPPLEDMAAKPALEDMDAGGDIQPSEIDVELAEALRRIDDGEMLESSPDPEKSHDTDG